MAGLQDLLARGQAAGAMMREAPMEAPPTDEMAELPEMPAEEDGLEAALAQVDAALEGMDAQIAEEIRGHLNQIRDLASKDPGGEEVPVDAEAEAPIAPPEDPAAGGEQPGGLL